jgi:hypothetical protein
VCVVANSVGCSAPVRGGQWPIRRPAAIGRSQNQCSPVTDQALARKPLRRRAKLFGRKVHAIVRQRAIAAPMFGPKRAITLLTRHSTSGMFGACMRVQPRAKNMERTAADAVTKALLGNIHRKLQEAPALPRRLKSAPKAAKFRLRLRWLWILRIPPIRPTAC